MADMIDYLLWRGDLTFAQAPLNPVDTLIFATLSYLRFAGIVPEAPGEDITLAAAADALLAAPDAGGLMRDWSYRKAKELFSEGDLPDAIFAFSDITALKIMEAAEDCGVRIPEDVSLLGYDNISFSALPRIDLTTVSQQKHRLGQLAVERLLEQIGGSKEHTVDILQTKLIIRSTCKNKQGGQSHERDSQ